MRRFKDLLKSKFVWGPKDIEHEPKEKKETAVERADKFIWKHGDLEHHDIKENLEEKFTLPLDHPGNVHSPRKINADAQSFEHPFSKPNAKQGRGAPEPGDESHEAFSAHHDSLDDDEKSSLYKYKGSGHRDINRYLRDAHSNFKEAKKKHWKDLAKKSKKMVGDKPHHEPDHDDDHDHDYHEHEMDDHVHHLDNVTNHRTVEHHVVYRGGHPGDKYKFPIGHEFTDHGYTSTSFSHLKARGFADSHAIDKHIEKNIMRQTHKNHVHVIHVPKGSRGHYFDVHGDDDDSHPHGSEKEFVLHRGTRFKVTHHSEDENTHYIHSRVVKQGIRHKFTMKRKQDGSEPKQHKFPFMKRDQH